MTPCYICNTVIGSHKPSDRVAVVCPSCDVTHVQPLNINDRAASNLWVYVIKKEIAHLAYGGNPAPVVLAIEVPTAPELASLRLVADEKHWRCTYNMLEVLVNKGWVNSTLTRLTKAGKEILGL